MSRMGQPIKIENRLTCLRLQRGAGRKLGVTADGYRASFWSYENVLKPMVVMLYSSVNVYKTTELYTLNRYVNYILIKSFSLKILVYEAATGNMNC